LQDLANTFAEKHGNVTITGGPFGRDLPFDWVALEKGTNTGEYFFTAINDKEGTFYRWKITRTSDGWDISEPEIYNDTKTINITNANRFGRHRYILFRKSGDYYIPYGASLPEITEDQKDTTLSFKVNTQFSVLRVFQGEGNFTTDSNGIDMAAHKIFTVDVDIANTQNNTNISVNKKEQSFSLSSSKPIYLIMAKIDSDKKTIISKLDENLNGTGYPDYLKAWLFPGEEIFDWTSSAKFFLMSLNGPVSSVTNTFLYNPDTTTLNTNAEIGVLTSDGHFYEMKKTLLELASISESDIPDINLDIKYEKRDRETWVSILVNGTDANQIDYCDAVRFYTHWRYWEDRYNSDAVPFMVLSEFIGSVGDEYRGYFPEMVWRKMPKSQAFIESWFGDADVLVITCYSADESIKVTRLFRARGYSDWSGFYFEKMFDYPEQKFEDKGDLELGVRHEDLVAFSGNYWNENDIALTVWKKEGENIGDFREEPFEYENDIYTTAGHYYGSGYVTTVADVMDFYFAGAGNYTIYASDYKKGFYVDTKLEVNVLENGTMDVYGTSGTIDWNPDDFSGCQLAIFEKRINEEGEEYWNTLRDWGQISASSGSVSNLQLASSDSVVYLVGFCSGENGGYELKFKKYLPSQSGTATSQTTSSESTLEVVSPPSKPVGTTTGLNKNEIER